MSEENTQQSSLEKELNKLGENLGNLVRAMWESEERKSIERELTANLEQVNKRMNDAVEKVRTDQTTSNLKKGVQDAWETARGPQILNELQTGLTDTLRKLNDEISRRAQPAQEVRPDDDDEGGEPMKQTMNGDPVGMGEGKPE